MAPMLATRSDARPSAKPRRRAARGPRTTRGAPCGAVSNANGRLSHGIVEDHAEGVPLARVELADAVVQLHLVVASHPLHRSTVDRENGRIPLLERQNHRAGLHARALLGHPGKSLKP